MRSSEKNIARLFLIHLGIISAFSLAFRIFLLPSLDQINLKSILLSFSLGQFFDFIVAIYSLLPLIIIILLTPKFLLKKINSWRILGLFLAFDIFFFLFLQVSEYFFFEEFKDRFNFIAVDYLVYTHEVIRNIWESYPIVIITGIIFLFSSLGAFYLTKILKRKEKPFSNKFSRSQVGFLYIFLFLSVYFGISEKQILGNLNSQEELLSKNGIHTLFSAYLNNEIKFTRFYTNMDELEATQLVQETIKGNYKAEEKYEDRNSIIRNIREPRKFKKYNVILVAMESLSARFMKAYGNEQDLTPNLDRFSQEGLFFDNVYATGTRTVRGLEALLLSIPPTPGQSIVRRPEGTGIFNLGSVFRDNGYKTSFIYGGRALFDNMGHFFEGNGFEVKDQTSFPNEEIHFSNAWGVSDEDLFQQVLKESDYSYSKKEKFFHFVLNTSNHRPFTYPSGKVKIPSGSGRDGAVQYSDYAIGKFISNARKKPWFDSTIFVFVADHNASVAGGTKILPSDYLIPFIVYSPKLIVPQKNHRLGSQIDVAPTILDLLSASYQSKFFGMDLTRDYPNRAFLGTYQSVAFMDEKSLIILSPNQKVGNYLWKDSQLKLLEQKTLTKIDPVAPLPLRLAVSFYETASSWFTRGLLKENIRISENINQRD